MLSRRLLAAVLAAPLPPRIAGPASADEAAGYPDHPIRMIVPYPPGGGGDAIARVLAPKLQDAPGQTIVIENRPGAGASIGTDMAAKAPPDGYTILVTPGTGVTVNPQLMKVPYDPVTDWVPVAMLTRAIAVGGDKRWVLLPDVPSMAEAGYPSVRPSAWYGVFVPRGTPPEIVAKLSATFRKIISSPELAEKLDGIGMVANPLESADFAAVIQDDIATNGNVIREAHVTLDGPCGWAPSAYHRLHAQTNANRAAPVKLGIVSDIHCNVVGLREALEVMGPIDELLCLGDAIDRSRFSNDVISLLKDREAHIVLGNHEEAYLAEHGPGKAQRDGVDRDLLAFLAAQPLRRMLTYGQKKVLMIHSTPWEPRGEYIFPHNEKLALFADAGADYVLYGHTHAHVISRINGVAVVNPGSAGEGRDSSDGRHLSCAVLDTVSDEVRLVHYMDPQVPPSGA